MVERAGGGAGATGIAPPGSDPGDDYPDDHELVTGEAVALDLRPGSFVLRAAGTIIDFIAMVVLFLVVIFGLGALSAAIPIDDAAFQAVVIAAIVTVTVLIPMTVETLSRGKSLGRLALGLRIVRDDGGAIGLRHAFIRALLGFLELFSTFGGLAALVALLNPRSKRLGDLLAGTYSQYERVGSARDPIFAIPSDLIAWSRTADVARLPDRVARRVVQFLRQSGSLLPAARIRVANELAAEVTPYLNPIPDAHPEALLLAVVAIRRERESQALLLQKAALDRLEPVLGGLPHRFPDRG